MSYVTFIIGCIVVVILLWLVNAYVIMDARIKKVLNIVVPIALALWLLKVIGTFGYLRALLI
jgi:hypothetical protein